MIKPAHFKTFFVLIAFAAAALVTPLNTWAAAGSPQICHPEQTCTIGEFLYDDSYAPITTADICSLTAKYPDGSAFLTNQNMPASSDNDGWYSYEFTTPTTLGLYRAVITCTVDEQVMRLDKSFEVKSLASEGGGVTPAEIAEAVWGYSSRTLSGFGTLVTDIWGFSGRTLTSFGSLATDIWNSATRTLTGSELSSGRLATESDVGKDIEDIKKVTQENRLLLEQLVNKPIIQNFLEEDIDLVKKIDETKTYANQLYVNHQYIRSKVGLITSRWNTLSERELLDTIMEVNSTLGEESDSSSGNTYFAYVNWFKKNWNWQQTSDVYDQTRAVKRTLVAIQNSLGTYGKSNTSYSELRSLVAYLDTLEKIIGDSTNSAQTNTLFGKIKETQDLARIFDSQEEEVDTLLAESKKQKGSLLQQKLDELMKKILAVNKVPRATNLLAASIQTSSTDKRTRNTLFGLRALINANRLLLVKGPGVAFANTWLEEGSIIFKSMITNPSSLISQDVPLKYYLPPEVKEETIIDVDEGLSVGYDSEKDQYFVEGEFTLNPGETKTLAVRVDDIWVISEADIESLRKQAEELSRPLEKTAYFAQGVTLKSDVNVSLDKILSLQAAANTPEQKIRAYREAQIELDAVVTKMDNLKNLVTQASSTGTLFGFVGGAQTLAVWGLIIIMVAGFVFLAVFMRNLNGRNNHVLANEGLNSKAEVVRKDTSGARGGKILMTLAAFLIFGAVSALISGLVVRHSLLNREAVENNQTAQNLPEEKVLGAETDTDEEEAVGGQEIVRVVVTGGAPVDVKMIPNLTGVVIARFRTTTEVIKVSETENWVKIVFESEGASESISEGWVEEKFIERAPETEE